MIEGHGRLQKRSGALMTIREESTISPQENLHVPKLRVTNPEALSEGDNLKKLRECVKRNDVPSGFSKNKKELRLYPYTSTSRQNILEILDSFKGITYIAPQPLADRQRNILIVLRN